MTFDEFKTRVNTKTAFDKYWYYGLTIAVTFMSVYLMTDLITRVHKFGWAHVFLYAVALILLLLAISALYLLPNRYKIVTIPSFAPLAKKRSVFINILDECGYKSSAEQNHASFVYRRGFWKTPYSAHLFFDDQRFALSIQVQDYFNGGFIDFGGTEKQRKDMASKILHLLAEE